MASAEQSSKQPKSGLGYFSQGFELISTKGLKRFVLIPLTINLLLFGSAFYYLVSQMSALFEWLLSFVPDWLSWLEFIMWPLAIVFVLVTFSFLFSTLANWIAAPFNGLLAEKVELHLTGQPPNQDGFMDVLKDTPRLLKREWTKLKYYLPKAIGFLLLSLFVPVIGQIVWFIFSCWSMAIQYLDYPFDNHKIGFDKMREALKAKQTKSYSFGFGATVCAMVPFVNLIVMPVAICGATAMWVEEFKQQNQQV